MIAIDIGNTNITVGIFKGQALKRTMRFPTEAGIPLYIIRKHIRIAETVVIASVVPKALAKLKKQLRRHRIGRVLVLGENIRVPIRNLYRKPAQVGQDRLVNAYSGFHRFGGPLIAVDFGTAITFDCVSGKGEYLGGVIVPGMELALNTLLEHAALLPKQVRFARPKGGLIGKTTLESIQSGIFNGYAALCDGMIKRLRARMPGARVVATGGHAKDIALYATSIQKISPELTLRGLYLVYQKYLDKDFNFDKISTPKDRVLIATNIKNRGGVQYGYPTTGRQASGKGA